MLFIGEVKTEVMSKMKIYSNLKTGSIYVVIDGELCQIPLLISGIININNAVPIDWDNITESEKRELKEIKRILEGGNNE